MSEHGEDSGIYAYGSEGERIDLRPFEYGSEGQRDFTPPSGNAGAAAGIILPPGFSPSYQDEGRNVFIYGPDGTQYVIGAASAAWQPYQTVEDVPIGQRLSDGSFRAPSGHALTPRNAALAFARSSESGFNKFMENLPVAMALGGLGAGAGALAGAGAGAGVGAESAVAGGLEYSGIVDAFEWGSAASGATVGAAEGGSIATGAGVGAESAVVGGLEYAGVPSVAAPALASAGAVTGTAGAAELMGPSAVELGVPGATGYAAPYAASLDAATLAPATVATATTGASTGAGEMFGLTGMEGVAPAAGGAFPGSGILSSVIDWAKANPVLSNSAVTVAGGLIKGALAPTPKEQADAAFQAKLQAENQAADARRSRNRFNLNLNRLKPTGAVLRQPGIIRGSMPRQP